MFSQLLDGVRRLRIPLMAGYVLLFTAWLIGHDHLSERKNLTEPAESVADFYGSLSSGSRAALWSFLALMLGSLFENLILRHVVAHLLRYGPDWGWFIDEARWRSTSYEEYSVTVPGTSTSGIGSHGQTYTVPSTSRSLDLRAATEDRVRRHAEIEFRIAFALMLLFPATTLTIQASDWRWALTFLPSVLVLADVVLLHGTTTRYMTRTIRDEIGRELESQRKRLQGMESTLADDTEPKRDRDRAGQEARRQRAGEEIPNVKARIGELERAENTLSKLRKEKQARAELRRVVDQLKDSSRDHWSRTSYGRHI